MISMPLITQSQEQWLYWRLFVGKIVLFSLVQFSIAYKAATEHVDMSKLTGWEMTGVVAAMVIIWGTTMLALFDRTLGQLAKGKLPNGSGGTDFFEKAAVVTTTTTTETKPAKPPDVSP
jgi:hypothetical protein